MDYVIAALPRTGSHYLCELLAWNGICIALEDFNIALGKSPFPLALAQNVSTEDYLENIRQKRGRSDSFGTKIMAIYLDAMLGNMAVPTYSYKNMFEALFPNAKYIFITRKNRLYQAVSLAKARKTKQWRKAQNEKAIEADLSSEEVHEELLYLVNQEQKWKQVFHQCGIEPFHIIYEDFIVDVEDSLEKALSYLDWSFDKVIIDRQMSTIQSSENSDLIYKEYLKRGRELCSVYSELFDNFKNNIE